MLLSGLEGTRGAVYVSVLAPLGGGAPGPVGAVRAVASSRVVI